MLVFMQVHGLQTSLLICDGAGPNLSVLKTTHGHSGMYDIGKGADVYAVKPWFSNPFKPLHYIYWLICPSYQVHSNVEVKYIEN